VSAPADGSSRLAAFGRYLEIQNLGLNLPFAIAFFLTAAHGVPAPVPVLLVLVAFVAARNAGHSFNRWADREYDAANPRTRDRALVTGRYAPGFALAFATLNAAVLVVAAYLLNPLAFVLSFIALAIVLGYTYTKRYSALTTPFLGFVEAITPAAIYIALTGALPWGVLWAVGGMLLWGTAFETIHSLGDLEADRAAGLRSLPLRLGRERSLTLLPVLHLAAVGLWVGLGLWVPLGLPYYLALAVVAAAAIGTDLGLRRGSLGLRDAFRRHFVFGAVFLAGVVIALAVPAATL
jgi:4-hydroxybenzoate polyprenyltransferase